MEVIDQPDGKAAEKVEEEASFMLTNNSGGFCLLSSSPKSRFEGVFFREGDKVYKAIDCLRINEPVKKLTNHLWTTSRERDTVVENFFMPLHSNSLVYELSEKSEFELVLDCRHIYDNRQWGRVYEITQEHGCIVAKFMKRNSKEDDNTEFNEEFDIYVAVFSDDVEFKQEDKWEKFFYELDKERDSTPFDKHVYYACKLRCKEAVFAFSTTKKKAIKEAKYVWRNRESLKKKKEDHVSNIIHRKDIDDEEVAVAYQCSLNAIDSMSVDDSRISAGLPWFFQTWARDELICLKSLINMEQYAKAKKILFKYLHLIGPEAKVPERDLDPTINSSDGTLWLFKRFEDFLDELNKKKLLKKYMSKRDAHFLTEKLSMVVSQWMKYHSQEGLIINGPRETWMDSDWEGDLREGARIEIQALFLSCLRLLGKLHKKDKFEKELAKTTKKMFFTGKTLSDGVLDPTVRPNAFIAAYVYPELLSKKEWIKCFENMLPKLWLKWGGLSSIDKDNKLYTSRHTGENPQSYHRGDSWFWINNMAAIVLHRLDKNKFAKYIKSIINASVEEMLYLGVTGYSAELSSASDLKSQGCFAQAWSSALFVELIDEVYK